MQINLKNDRYNIMVLFVLLSA